MSTMNNKTVIITGASKGIGAACARLFAKQGARLVLIARGESALNAITEELSPVTEVFPVVLDVADTEATLQMLDKVMEKFNVIHYLINNAGLHHRGTVTELKPQYLGAMVDVNMRAPLVLSAAVIPYIKQSGGGTIINVGSLAGRAPLQGAATYSATKAGLRAFSYALADELATTNVRVALVSPGPVDTGFIMDEIDKVDDIVYSQPMSTAKQVSEAILKLAKGNKVEIALPALSGKLTSIMYFFPKLRRWVRPQLQKLGRKNKDKYRHRTKKPSHPESF